MATIKSSTNLFDEETQARSAILSREIPWMSYKSAKYITSHEFELITEYSSSDAAKKKLLFSQSAEMYAGLFLKILHQILKPEPIEYTLSIIEDILVDEKQIQHFLVHPDAAGPFVKLLFRDKDRSWFASQKTIKILAIMLVNIKNPDYELQKTTVNWCLEQLRKTDDHDLDVGLVGLQVLLRVTTYRHLVQQFEGESLFKNVLSNYKSNPQLLYQAQYCLWLLSYDANIGSAFEPALIKQMVEVLRSVQKDKVIRVILATLVNLIKNGNRNLAQLDHGLMRILTNLNNRKWGDDDITNDLNFLTEAVQKCISEMSSFEAYTSEIQSGRLEWTPVHRSDKFWKENAVRFEEDNCKVLGVLAHLLENSETDTTTVAVACHDIGEFIRYHPRGRTIISKLALKVSIMKLMMHDNPEIQKHALLCVQKLMVTNWEFLAK